MIAYGLILKHFFTLSACPILVGFKPAVIGLGFLHNNQFFDVTVKKSDYDIETLIIMMQKLEPRTLGLKPLKLERVGRKK